MSPVYLCFIITVANATNKSYNCQMSSSTTIESFLPFLLYRASELSSGEFGKNYADRYGMLRSEWRVLFHLGVSGTMTARDICQVSRLHKTKVSRAVKKLVDRRFVVRLTDESDRRFENLSLTKRGNSVYDDLISLARGYEQKFLSDFTSREIETLKSLLHRISLSHPV